MSVTLGFTLNGFIKVKGFQKRPINVVVFLVSRLSFDDCFILFYRSHSYRGAAVVPRSN